MTRPTVPRDWTVRGDLPDIDPVAASEDSLELLDEDLIQIVDPSGTFTLDVGWYPAASRAGKFVCRAISSTEWDSPLEEVETRDRLAVLQWFERWIAEVQDRLGEPGSISHTAVTMTILPELVTETKPKSTIVLAEGAVDTKPVVASSSRGVSRTSFETQNAA